jgi:hypothetical protein
MGEPLAASPPVPPALAHASGSLVPAVVAGGLLVGQQVAGDRGAGGGRSA